MNGYCLNTAALPALSKLLAIPGVQGDRGCLLVSRTNTKLDIFASLLLSCKVGLANVNGRYDPKSTDLISIRLFNFLVVEPSRVRTLTLAVNVVLALRFTQGRSLGLRLVRC